MTPVSYPLKQYMKDKNMSPGQFADIFKLHRQTIWEAIKSDRAIFVVCDPVTDEIIETREMKTLWRKTVDESKK